MIKIKLLLITGWLVTLGVLLQPLRAWAQDNGDSIKPVPLVYANHIYKPSVKTVRLYPEGAENSLPFISLTGGDKATLGFDEIGQDVQNYNYTLILCNANWTPNELTPFDYLGTFSNGVISDYNLSSATSVTYAHYSLSLPNSDIAFTKSGNYLIEVYENDNPAQPVLTERLYVLDDQVKIRALEKAPDLSQYAQTHQEVQFSIFSKTLAINNAFDEISATVMQNFRPDNAYLAIKPQYLKEDSVLYRTEGKIIFPGGKEFRIFDTRDLVTLSARVKSYNDATNIAYLFPDEIRSFKEYEYVKDFNGQFTIAKADMKNSDINADYVKVHFTLATNNIFPGGNIYVFGGMTDWQTNDDFKLDYMSATHTYEKDILLKQGFYNYIYAFVKKGNEKPETNLFEGNSYETENDYQILVYYHPAGTRYDQLVGFKQINTMKNKEGGKK